MTQCRDVHTKMRFVKPESKDNRRYITPGLEINTGFYEEREVLVRDARPTKDKFDLDSTGFQLFGHHTDVRILASSLSPSSNVTDGSSPTSPI